MAAAPDALAASPVLKDVVSSAIAAPAFRPIYEAAIRDLHQTMFLGDIDTFTVRLSDLVLIVRTQAAVVSPEFSARIPDDITDTLIEVQSHPLTFQAAQISENIQLLAFLLPLVALLSFAGAMIWAKDRRQTWIWIGVGIIVAGIVLLVAEALGGSLVVGQFEDETSRDIAQAFWSAFVADLALWGLVIAGFGSMMVAAVWWMAEPSDIAARLGQVRRFLEPPSSTLPRSLWVFSWVIIGAFLILRWQEATRVILTLVGVVLVVNAMAELLRIITPGQLRSAPSRAAFVGLARWWLPAGGVLLAAIIAGGFIAIDRSGGEGIAAATFKPGCNGHVLLCDRAWDNVTIAATHNSMASAEDGFILANHSKGIIPQLEAGYRGLLIDLYYGIASDRLSLVVTDVAPLTPEEREELVDQLGEAAVRSSEELRRRNLAAGGTRDVYLCHGQCEIGATRFSTELERIRDWLERNPREVLLIIIEDHVKPDDVAGAFEAAGLVEYVHTQAFDAPWPTLLEMIDSGKRLLVMAENNTGDVAWYHDVFTFIQETPYAFGTIAEFNCDPSRGRPDSPLFMINHWVTPALAEAGTLANSAEVLNKRISACRQERGLLPNVLAVDFYARGDALTVVAALNGVQ